MASRPFAQLLMDAACIHATGDTALVGSKVRDFALAVLSLLAEDAPCGWALPSVRGDYVLVPATWPGLVTPSDARALARMLLRAADEADAKGKP